MADTWEPRRAVSLDLAQLERFITLVRDGHLDDLDAHMRTPDVEAGGLMHLPDDVWAEFLAAAALDDASLVDLLRFFTVAEMQLRGWKCGATSPVIPIARALRARGAWRPELARWIRERSDNRFLPYGSIQGL